MLRQLLRTSVFSKTLLSQATYNNHNVQNRCMFTAFALLRNQSMVPFSLVFRRPFSTTLLDTEKELRILGEKFGEARMEIEDAKDSAGTVYFNEDSHGAKELVKDVLQRYQNILDQLEGGKMVNIQRTWGLKMEQLKGEVAELEQLGTDNE